MTPAASSPKACGLARLRIRFELLLLVGINGTLCHYAYVDNSSVPMSAPHTILLHRVAGLP